ncbi:MAG: T9SS type A sorting domain-containing protein [Bacteroidia bacterium]|nr:T9SS type A sorting domain-containing protein [Bacteroidia bacterium]
MKNLITLFILCSLTLHLMAQKPRRAFANQAQITQSETIRPEQKQLFQQEKNLVSAAKVSPAQTSSPSAPPLAPSAINPISIGRMTNVFSAIHPEQNQVVANTETGLVAWIHRQDVTIWGGGSTATGKFRYDLSTDAGLSWTTEIGPLQTLYTSQGRFPNMTHWNQSASNFPFDEKLIWGGPTYQTPVAGFSGHVFGMAEVTNGPFVTSTENYITDPDPVQTPGGLCEGMPGEFWTAEFDQNNENIYLYKGVYNASSQDFDWSRHDTLVPNHFIGPGGGITVGPNISFSPDGETGYVVWLGDIVGGHDSLVMPCYFKTEDGGITWDASPTEIDLRTIPWIHDTLTSLWVTIDSLTGDTIPIGSGRPTTGFDFDITVDMNGNLHIGTIIANGTTTGGQPPAYAVFAGLGKFMADIFTPDGGATWDVSYLAPILAFRGEFGNVNDPITMDNFCQVSRTHDGSRIFFSWVDSDTTVTGFGEFRNLAPNLRISGKRITDGTQTCHQKITDKDLLWDGKALWPSMAPEVITSASGNRHYLPIVWIDLLIGDQNLSCAGIYAGNDAEIIEHSFKDPALLNFSFDYWNCIGISRDKDLPATSANLKPGYPNPATSQVTLSFELEKTDQVELSVSDLLGRKMTTVAQGILPAGEHSFAVKTENWAPGVYLCELKTTAANYSQKLINIK